MNFTLTHFNGHSRQLVLFLILSLLLHIAILLAVHPLTNRPAAPKRGSVTVYLARSPVLAHIPIRQKSYIEKRGGHGQVLPVPNTTHRPKGAETISTQQLIESANNMAREEGRKTEQGLMAGENKRLNTPAGALEQYMRMPHKEIRLADGKLKIVTELGSICFQPAPYFARGSAGVFGIPTTCP